MANEDVWVWEAGDDPGFTWSGGSVDDDGVSSPADAYKYVYYTRVFLS
jgi:hypothetical protein